MTMSSCAGTHAMAMRQPLSFDGVQGFLDTLFGDELAVGTALRDCAQAGCAQCWFSL